MAALEELLTSVQTGGGGRIAEVVGEPGIGKTRLLAELQRKAEVQGCAVLVGRAAEFEVDLPFGIFVDAFDDYLAAIGPEGLADVDAGSIPELATVFPAFVPLGGRGQAALPAERHRAYRAVRSLVQALSRTRPLVVALDDAHWADPASAELLGYLLAHPVDAPVLLAIAFRPVPTPPRLATALAAAVQDHGARRLDLRPLSRAEAEKLASSVEADVREAIYRESGGNPFYLEQLARAVRAQSGSTGPLHLGVGEAAVPAPVAAALASELDALPAASRALLEGAAVAGDPFEYDLASYVSGLDAAEALEHIDELTRAALVSSTAAPRRFRFRHPIIRRAVYESTGAGWRVGAHARAAAALTAEGGSAAALAHHLERSAKPGDATAMAALIAAGRAASARAPATAAHWYGAAIRFMPADDLRRLELLAARATALGAAGELDESRAVLLEVLDLIPPEMGSMRVDVVCFCAMVELLLGHEDDARARLLQALAAVPDGQSREAANLKVELAFQASFVGDFARSRDWAAEASATTRTLDDAALDVTARAVLAYDEFTLGYTAEALALIAEVTPAFDNLDDDVLALRPITAYHVVFPELLAEKYDEALRHAERGVAICRATGQGHCLVPIMHGQVTALVMKGRLDDALELASSAVEAARLAGHTQSLSTILFLQSWAATWTGDLDLAITVGQEAVDLVEHLDQSIVKAATGVFLALALVEAERFGEARAQMIASTGGPELPLFGRLCRTLAYEGLTRAELALGQVAAAGEWVTRAEAATHGFGLPVEAAPARRAKARLLLAQDRAGAAAELALVAVEAASGGGAPVEAARSRALAGRALALAGDRSEAIVQLERAEGDLIACGARRFADDAAVQLRRLGRRRARSAHAPSALGLNELTPRELEIAELIAAGKTNRQIAVACYLSEKTVEGHLSRIFGKLGVSSRAGVAGIVARHGAQRDE